MRIVARWMMVGLLATASCVEQPPQRRGAQGPSQQEVEAVRRRVASRTAPTPQHPLNYNYGNKVTLLGYDLSPANVRPGTSMTVTWYWRVDASTGEGWRLYTHIDDANAPRQNLDNEGDVRRAYQPDRWRQGEYITDRQTFEVPADWSSPVLKLHVGLWRGDERMRLVSGRQPDPDGRVLAAELPTGVVVTVSEMDAPRASGAITVDGRLDEPAWRSAGTTGPLVAPGSGAPPGPSEAHGSVRVLWDDRNLYLGWTVEDDNLVQTGTARDAHLWDRNDAVEVLIDPDGNGRDYYEIQVSPGNVTFDTQHAGPPAGENFGNVGWNPGLQTAVVANGTLGNEADTDTSYTVEMAIPWSDINAGLAHTPPQVGDALRVNFFLMDRPKNGGQRAAGWSAPRGPSFHATERFGRITLRDVNPVVVPENPLAPAAGAQGGAAAGAGAQGGAAAGAQGGAAAGAQGGAAARPGQPAAGAGARPQGAAGAGARPGAQGGAGAGARPAQPAAGGGAR